MRGPWLWLAVMVAHHTGAAEASEIGPVRSLGSSGLERGIASLRCAIAAGIVSSSRGAILEVGSSTTTDVVLTTAHGLPPHRDAVKRNCRVIARGRDHRITEVWHAGGDLLGSDHDWAVIVTERLPGDVRRWRVGYLTSGGLAAVAQQGSLTLVLRSAEPNDCKLEKRGDLGVLVAHSCIAYPGMSGSPLVVGLGGELEPVLVAIHLGTQLRWLGTKLDFASVARPLDAEIAAAIEGAAARTLDAPSRRRERR